MVASILEQQEMLTSTASCHCVFTTNVTPLADKGALDEIGRLRERSLTSL